MSLVKLTYPAFVGSQGVVNGVRNIIEAWNGLAIDPRDSTIYSVANGGHYDWAGNEVLAIKMSDNAPKWIEKKPSSPPDKIVEYANYYADKSPTSRHSFYGQVFNVSRNRVLILTGYWFGPSANMINQMDGYSVANNSYDHVTGAVTYAPLPEPASKLAGAPFVVDPTTDDIYCLGDFEVNKWSSSTNTWSRVLGNSYAGIYSAAAAFDTQRKRILVCGGDHGSGAPSVCQIIQISSDGKYSSASVKFDSNSLSETVLDGPSGAMVYDPVVDAFFLRKGASSIAGGIIYKIDAKTMTISQLDVNGTGAGIPGAHAGLWAKFLYAPQLGGAFLIPMYDSSVWFLRTH